MSFEDATYRTGPLSCPHCAKPLDGHTGLGHEEPPEAGAVTVCLYCLRVSTFERDDAGELSLRLPTEEEEFAPEVVDYVSQVRQLVPELAVDPDKYGPLGKGKP